MLAQEDRPRDAEAFDKYVTAELPDKDMYPKLWEVVTKNMLHGPCDNCCIVKGRCTKRWVA